MGSLQVGDGFRILGAGPIPVDTARQFIDAGDAFIKGVVHDGIDILAVQHIGRTVPAELQTALAIGVAPSFTGPECGIEGCGRREGLQRDHKNP